MSRVALLLLLQLVAGPCWTGEVLRVAVASNFKPTLEQINRQFEAETGAEVVVSSASTGVLYSQVLHGAPFDLLFAADRRTPERLYADGVVEDAPFCYALGTLVLAGGDGSLAQLANPDHSLAIANPATAPYGSAAMEVLAREEFRPGESRKLVRGNNVAQAYQFWHGGTVDLALVASALAPDATAVPSTWHRPLEQHVAVLRRSPAASAYLKWIRSDTVREIITDAGYLTCP
jgi:molybdate transport system substrate-binding protein